MLTTSLFRFLSEQKLKEKVMKTWHELKQEEIRNEIERVKRVREKNHRPCNKISSLTQQTEFNKGHESRFLVEEMLIEKRLNRVPMYASANNTWSPEPVKRATKKDYFSLLKAINTRKYVDPKRKRKMATQQRRSQVAGDEIGSVPGSILKKPSMLDLTYMNSRNSPAGGTSTASPIKHQNSAERDSRLSRLNKMKTLSPV